MQSNQDRPLLSLLQLSDSALPLGGYSHSWGLETWVQGGQIKSAPEAKAAIEALMKFTVAPGDGLGVCLANRSACREDITTFSAINAQLSAMRWAPEPHEASLAMGNRLKTLALDVGLVSGFPKGPVHHACAFGWLSGALKIPAGDAVTAFLFNSAASLISACLKLIPLGHTDGQRILTSLKPLMANLADECQALDIEDLGGFAPMNEWACKEHETLYSRLFQS